ncbi:cytochrome P450 [Aestuariibius sp. HNIBRBA575]|uniref:cytochrome P450 n=1 Tax=Aestuariibius sp. HNIBRBA575 TaxID=3233343 RepID=UPI0034A43772
MKTLSQSPTDPDFIQNPYAFYDRARAVGDIFFWTEYDQVVATSYQAATTILKDRRFGREAPPEFAPQIPDHLAPFYAFESHSMLELEPPTHTRLRSLVLRAFTTRGIAGLAPDITELSNELIDKFPDEPFDLIENFAKIIPVVIICRLLGVPEHHGDQLLAWSNDMVAMYQARRTREIEDAAVAATKAFSDFMRGHIDDRRGNPGDDLITRLIAAEEDGEKLSTDELITTCVLLLNAGHEATVHTLGNGVKALLENGKPDITDKSVEEVFRFDPPLQLFGRWCYEAVELFGHTFQRGDQVHCALAAANRDPDTYPNPNVFDPNRTGPTNTSFGGGLHFCVGAPLARLEVKLALTALFDRCPNLTLSEPAKYADVYHFRGLTKLMVTK